MLRQFIENRMEFNKEMVIAFIAINKVSNLVLRSKIWEAVEKKSINGGMFEKIKNTYEQCINSVRIQDKKSWWFKTKKGMRQGSLLFPLVMMK